LAHEFLDYVDQRTGLLKGNGGDLEKPTSYSLPHRIFQEYLAGCYLVRDRSAAREYYHHAAEGDYWTLAAQLGAEEMYYNRRGRHTMRDLAYELLPGEHPTSPAEQRASLWSGLIAIIAGKEEIEGDENSPKGGPKYLKLVRPALLRVLQGDLSPIERAEAGRALAKLGDSRLEVLTCECMSFCHIPAGSFLYGDKKKENLTGEFWMGRFPVTNAQYRQFVTAGGYAEARFWPEAIKDKYWEAGKFKGKNDHDSRSEPVDFGEPYTLSNHPVVGVTWYEAQAFTRWLSARLTVLGAEWEVKTGLNKSTFWQRLASQQLTVLLPSEEHWEKAARGINGHTYPWGETANPNRANYDKTGIKTTNAVGCFPSGKSPFGVFEMSGNVWEWTSTLEDEARVLRGGSFDYSAGRARCAYHLGFDPDTRYPFSGFRVMVVSQRVLSKT
jgi:formylglycine-generating enzyme required for sulfatase activity